MFPNNTKGGWNQSESSPKTDLRTSFYARTTRASSRISTPRWRCCTFEHRRPGLIKARTRSFWRWTVSRFVWVPWWWCLRVWSVRTGVPPLSRFLSLSREWIVFLGVFSVARERTRRSCVCWSFFWISSNKKYGRVLCVSAPSSSFFSSALALALFREDEKSTTLWRFIHIFPHLWNTHTHTHNAW